MASTDRIREQVLAKLDLLDYYQRVEGLDLTDLGNGQYQGLCPFHEDSKPSFTVGPQGVFLCFACGAKGSVFDFYMKRHSVVYTAARRALAESVGINLGSENHAPIPESEIEDWAKALHKNKTVMAMLKEERGFTTETIKAYQLGWDGQRITIPVRDTDGVLVNVRRYLPHAKEKQRKMLPYEEGYNKARVFLPKNVARGDTIILCEGETDCILLNQEGFLAITVTAGAGTWRAEWTPQFSGKRVILMLDNDDAGRRGTDKVGRFFLGTAQEVVVVQWPEGFKDKGDVTDFIVDEHSTHEDVQHLLDNAVPFVPRAEEQSTGQEFTDVGNAKRLVSQFGDDVRYCNVRRSWLVWDGRRWSWDEVRTIERLAKETAFAIRRESSDEESMKELLKFSLRSQSSGRIKAMIELAMSEEAIAVRPSQLDTKAWDLNTLNGVVDLHTGELRDHDKVDLATKLSAVEFDPAATSKSWQRLLDESTNGDKDLQSYLQRAVGYSLTGDVSEEVLFFIFGPTATGKSTFLESLKSTMGDYAMTANFASFLETREGGEHRGDIARTAGSRLLVSIEVEEGKKLAEGLVKQLTGGDKITARFLYQEAFEFFPTAKLWLSANHKPRVSDEDDAIWRRIRLIPFEHIVPKEKRDPRLKQELMDTKVSGAAILAWAVQGCLAWQREGLGAARIVESATLEYRAEQDPLVDWMAESTTESKDKEIENKVLVASYLQYCKDNGIRYPLPGKAVSYRLTKRGYPLRKAGAKVFRVGLVLATGAARGPEEEGEF